MTTAFLILLGSTPGASASNTARVSVSTRHTAASSNANIASLALPVVIHTAAGLAIAVGDAHFPVTATPVRAPAKPVAPVAPVPATPVAPAAAPVQTAAAAVPAAAPAPTPAAAVPAAAPAPVNDDTSVDTADWQCIRIHESGDNYNDPNMPSGAYGILISTWQSLGYSGWPYQAAPALQDAAALRLHAEYGFEPWGSRFACGL
jgi:hypothetical protein